MKTQILLYFLLAWLCVESKSSFGIQISGLTVTITCPTEGETILKKDGKAVDAKSVEHVFSVFSEDKNGLYDCENANLYLHAYVCENCVEVSVLNIVIILIADCLLTLGVSLVVYIGSKKKNNRNNGMSNGGQNKGNMEHPPPVPDPDYMPLQKGRRDVYDGLNKKR